MENHAKLGTQNEQGKPAKPDYARFMAVIKFTHGQAGGYSTFPSWEFVNFGGNERQGLEDLINRVIKSIPINELREAKIFANLSLNLRTDSQQYNYPIACYKPVYSPKYGMQIKNVWYKKGVAFFMLEGRVRVHISETIRLQRESGNCILLKH